MSWRKVSLPVALLLSAGACYLAFRRIPLAQLLTYAQTIQYRWAVPAVLLVIVAFLLRVRRWQRIVAGRYGLGFAQAYHPLMIAFMLNCILPGRVGEMARPALLRRQHKIPFAAGLATVAAERLMDLLCLLFFFAVTMALVPMDPDLDIPFGHYHLNVATLERVGNGMVRLVLVLLIGVAMVTVPVVRRRLQSGLLGLPDLLAPYLADGGQRLLEQRICQPLARMLDNVAGGFALVRKPAQLVACLALSLTIWLLHGLSYYILARGCPGLELGFPAIFASMVLLMFFIALPSVPGYWGIWEAGGIFALTLFGVGGSAAAGFTLINHVVQTVPVVVLGVVSAWLSGVAIFAFRRQAGEE